MLTGRRSEGGAVALLAALAMLILGALIAITIFASTRSTSDTNRVRNDTSASERLARDAGAMLVNAYSTMVSGEQDGFAPRLQVLEDHAERIGGKIVPNSALGSGLGAVDLRVPASSRYAIEQDLRDGRFGYWQVYSIKVPAWGETPGGRVVAYVRTWTRSAASGATSTPVMYRLEFRPTWFADFLELFDGPVRIADGANINGRVHSNGYSTSYYDQYRDLGAQIRMEDGATCGPSARLSTASGDVIAPGGCKVRTGTGVRYNFLRARDAVARLREICAQPPTERPSIEIVCLDRTDEVAVTLAGSTVSADGHVLSALVEGDVPGMNQGAVIVASGDVVVRGTLGPKARALVVAASKSDASQYGEGGAPSAWITSNGQVGAANDPTSSFGLVVEGDVIFDERRMSRATLRGAVITMSGMVSINPTWRTRVVTAGGVIKPGPVRIEGSVAGHYPPALINLGNGAGFETRQITWLDALFDDPPPLYPTAADWEITRMEPANLDCFQADGALDAARADCA